MGILPIDKNVTITTIKKGSANNVFTEKFSTRGECVEELLSSMNSLDISEFIARRVSLADIIDERMARDPEDLE